MLAVVVGWGVDWDTESSEVILSAQIARPGSMEVLRAAGQGKQEPPVLLGESTGVSMFDAVRNLNDTLSRKPYWGHNQVIVLGMEAAGRGVRALIDKAARNPEDRGSAMLVVAEGLARDILMTKDAFSAVPSTGLRRTVMGFSRQTGRGVYIDLHSFANHLLDPNGCPVAPIVGEYVDEQGNRRARVVGTAVFRQDRMVGRFDGTETRGRLWLTGEVDGGIVAIPSPDGLPVSLEVIRAGSKVTPKVAPAASGSPVLIKVEIEVTANVGSNMSAKDWVNPGGIADLEEALAGAVKGEAVTALQKAHALSADVFGFGQRVHQQLPQLWKQLEEQWADFFPTTEVQITVKAVVHESGLTRRPLKP